MRAWWIASATNASFFEHFDGVFADNAIANADQIISGDGTRLGHKIGAALLAGQQALYTELQARFRELGGDRSVIFNGIREGQGFAAIPNLLPYADGGEMEGLGGALYKRSPNGSIDSITRLTTMHTLLNLSKQHSEKEVMLKAVPAGSMARTEGFTAADYRANALEHYQYPLAAFLVLAGEHWLHDYTWGYRSNDYVPPIDSSGSVPGLPDLQSKAPLGWYPDYLKAPGTPLKDAVFDGAYTFTREWTGDSEQSHREWSP